MVKAYILAGGKSSRMGTTKGMLLLRNKTFVEQIASALSPYFNEVILISNTPEYNHLPLRKIKDEIPGCGPLSGIHAALKDAANDKFIFITACDMPLIQSQMISWLPLPENDETVSCFTLESKTEPLFAYYSTTLISDIETALESKEWSMKTLFNSLKIKAKPFESLPANYKNGLNNINYPKEYDNLIHTAQ